MDNFFDDPLGLDPLSPLPYRDPRWFIPAHAAGSSRTANPSGRQTAIAQSVALGPARGQSTGRRGLPPAARPEDAARAYMCERISRVLDDGLAPMERRMEHWTWHL
jgi:hypothetical protein